VRLPTRLTVNSQSVMTIHFHLDESLWVLLLVCIPLLALLIVLIVLRARGSRRTARFADFSVTISTVGREEAYVKYVSSKKQAEFRASIGRGRRFFRPLIVVTMPAELTQEDFGKIASDVALGLGFLRYEYRIYRNNEVLARSDR
jgi:hypothetical protein